MNQPDEKTELIEKIIAHYRPTSDYLVFNDRLTALKKRTIEELREILNNYSK